MGRVLFAFLLVEGGRDVATSVQHRANYINRD